MAGQAARPKGFKLLRTALSTRKSGSMLAFGFSSGLPFALLIGTLNAWLGELKVNLATIGVLSWIGLAYSFKFLWSPAVDRLALPGLSRLGRRKSWITFCQAVLVLALLGLSVTDPLTNIGTFALIAFVAAFASATQDVAVDAWRIDVADEVTSVELLSAVYQFGYRIASIVGGAIALFLAARMSWPNVFQLMAGAMAVILVIAVTVAPDTPRPPGREMLEGIAAKGEIDRRSRTIAMAIVAAAWAWAISKIVIFMVSMLAERPAGVKPPSVGDFTKAWGPWIIVATVFVPLVVAATLNWLQARGAATQHEAAEPARGVRAAADFTYGALVAPLAELSRRLGWGVLVIIGFILTYALCYNLWSSFAFPFYLDYLKYTKDEVAFASKVFGIIMTMIGISFAGYLLARIGKFPTVLLGSLLPPTGNLVYADLADGGPRIDAVSHALMLDRLVGVFGFDERMVRLLLAISYENIATGIALTAFVAYLSGIVSKKFTAVQYALLSSLTFLVGTLGKGAVGEAFDKYGYATTFRWTAAFGFLSALFVLLEWIRSSRAERRASREAADLAKAPDQPDTANRQPA
ncbi:MFS transporter [Sphingomonas sp. ASV193]|uniref:AmpG family muropeptide MFS transporter n=1 Tax=Sphingomonas sp. ASV193 TaxID=3144405 RepID=UPI0032E8C23E